MMLVFFLVCFLGTFVSFKKKTFPVFKLQDFSLLL